LHCHSQPGKSVCFFKLPFSWLWKEKVNEENIFTISCGSGTENYINSISEKSTVGSSVEINNFQKLLTNTFLEIGKLIAKERSNLQTISNYWGAGFEVITFMGDSFQKIGDITYIILRGNVGKGGNLTASPILYMNFTYYGEFVGHYSIRWKDWQIRRYPY
jgi:hypothetical protein